MLYFHDVTKHDRAMLSSVLKTDYLSLFIILPSCNNYYYKKSIPRVSSYISMESDGVSSVMTLMCLVNSRAPKRITQSLGFV